MNRLAFRWSLVALVFAGCADKGVAPPATAKVAGTVTLDGKPMEGGEVEFSVQGQGVRTAPVQGGAFSGEAFVGQNQVSVVLMKDGPPHPMDPNTRMKVNVVSSQFQGASSTLKADVPAAGVSDLKFEVTSGAAP